MNSKLFSISPIDGRYQDQTGELVDCFSELALTKYRVKIEVKYLLALNRQIKIINKLTLRQITELQNIYLHFTQRDAKKIKQIEKNINHDVKAVEYFLQTKLKKINLKKLIPFIHFALTSEDINNLAFRLMWQEAIKNVYLPATANLINWLKSFARQYSGTPLLSLTHGQSATPTTVGKEINVFAARLTRQIKQLNEHKLMGKLNGAVGTWAAHQAAYPKVNWLKFSQNFIATIGLAPNLVTTQIEPGDCLAESYHIIFRINSILTDLCRDLWLYISRGIFTQKNNEKEVGSSTMPHKINPINFENAEGNLGVAGTILNHLAGVLTISRLQRDLSGSTAIRNQGVALAHSVLAVKQITKGLEKIEASKAVNELENHWEILAEAIQTVLRKYGDEKAYEKIKMETKGQKITKDIIKKIIKNSRLPKNEQDKLLKLTPQTYVGLAKKIAQI